MADRGSMASLVQYDESSQGRLAAHGDLQVKVIALDEWVARGELPLPD